MDSKASDLKGNPIANICKIRRAGRFYLAMSGFYDNPATGFDAWKLAGAATEKAGSVPEAASLAEKAISGPLHAAVEELRKADPKGFEANFSESYLTFFVVGTDSKKPLASARSFAPGETQAAEYPGDHLVRPGSVALNNFGERLALDKKYPRQTQGLRAGADPLAAAREFLQIEIDGEPAKVGPPISILELTEQGSAWIERGLCGKE
jgi:hypothetical protein